MLTYTFKTLIQFSLSDFLYQLDGILFGDVNLSKKLFYKLWSGSINT